MRIVSTFVLLLSTTALVPAQTVTVTTTPTTDYTVTAQFGGQTTFDTVPGSVSTPAAYIVTGQPLAANVSASWNTFASETEAGLLTQIVPVVEVPGGRARKLPSDLLVELQATSPVKVLIEVNPGLSVNSNADVQWAVDIRDDGNIEFHEQSAPLLGWSIGPYDVGPTPLRIRVHTAVDQQVPGSSLFSLRVVARPYNDLSIQQAMPPCGDDRILVEPSFVGQGLALRAALPNNPIVGVIGLGLQPQFLSSAFPTPCLLLPRPDLLVLLSPNQPLLLPMQPAVRPLTLWTQGVAITPMGLAVSNAEQITAQ